MSDNEGTAAQGPREGEQRLEGEIQKEINKLKYFLEETDDLIQIKDYTEMEIVTMERVTRKIADRLSDLISHDRRVKNRQRRVFSISQAMEKGCQVKLRGFNCRQRKVVENPKKQTRGDSKRNSSGDNWNRSESNSKRKSDRRPSFVRERKIMNGKCGRKNSRQS